MRHTQFPAKNGVTLVRFHIESKKMDALPPPASRDGNLVVSQHLRPYSIMRHTLAAATLLSAFTDIYSTMRRSHFAVKQLPNSPACHTHDFAAPRRFARALSWHSRPPHFHRPWRLKLCSHHPRQDSTMRNTHFRCTAAFSSAVLLLHRRITNQVSARVTAVTSSLLLLFCYLFDLQADRDT